VEAIATVENKPWYLSKTIWGAVAAVVGVVFPKILVALGGSDNAGQTLADLAGNLVTVIGSVVAIYSRYTATTQIAKIGASAPPKGNP
jgi:hypothetical protein